MSEKDIPGPRNSGSGDIGYGFVDLGRPDDDHPFIVPTETKFRMYNLKATIPSNSC